MVDFSQLKSNKSFSIIVGSIGFLFIVLAIFFVYKWLIKKAKQRPFIIKKPRRGDYIQNKDSSSGNTSKVSPYQHFDNTKIAKPQSGNGYSYSVWINVDNWDYNYDKPKHIFSKGDRDAVSVNPGVWLYPKENNLMVRVDTFGRTSDKNTTQNGLQCQDWNSQYPHKHQFTSQNYPKADLQSNYCRNPDNKAVGAWCFTTSNDVEWQACGVQNYKSPPSMSPYSKDVKFEPKTQCDLINIPIQRWVHIVLVLDNKTLDVYLNGKLARSCTYEHPPLFNDHPLHITDNGGFAGEIGEMRYINKPINAAEVYSIYMAGHTTFSLYDKLESLVPKVNVNIDVSASVGGSYGSKSMSTSGSI